MGLSERKNKQRIGYDPRNLTWSNDANRFSVKHMATLGWNENKGLGKAQDGMATHIAVARKMDNTGIGMGRVMRETGEMSAGAGQAGAGLEDVLRRLASRSQSASSSPAPTAPASPAPSASPAPTAGPSTLRNKIASRQKHLASKRLASQSPAALAEILGVPVSSLPASATASPAASTPSSAASSPSVSGASTPVLAERDADETVVKASISVGDYFRQKLREKALARQAAREAAGVSSPAPELAAGSLALIQESKNVVIGGVGWEGSKMKFEDVSTELTDLGGEENHAGLGSSNDPFASREKTEATDKSDKTDKNAEKEAKLAKEARRMEKEAKKAAKEAKRATKEAKRAAKEAKAATKEDKVEKKSKSDKKRKREEDENEGKRKSKSKSKSKSDSE